MQAYEDLLNQLEIVNHQPPPQIEYYVPESAYYTPYHPADGIPPTINVLPPSQLQWTGQETFQQQGQHPRKIVHNGLQWGCRQPVQFSHSSNITYQHPSPLYQNQPMGVRGFLGGLRQRRRGGTGKMQASHTNKIKRFHNLHYCFTCGWYVYHLGNACPLADTEYNMPNIPRAEAHMYANQVASMAA